MDRLKKLYISDFPLIQGEYALDRELFELFRNVTLKKLHKFIMSFFECNVSLDCIDCIFYQLVIFADFLCWDLLLELLEICTTGYIRFATFDSLGIYFQLFGQEHQFFKRYLFKAADFYRNELTNTFIQKN